MTIVKPSNRNVTLEERLENAPQACYAPVLVPVNAILLTARLKRIIVT
jgi:hypothetical protein